MAEGQPERAPRAPELSDLTALCAELNRRGAKYVVVGGFAVAEHGFVRGTEDIDLLIEDSPENQAKVRAALEILPDKAIREFGEDDLRDYVVLRVFDEVTVDLMLLACGISYAEALPEVVVRMVNGVPVPFPSMPLLLRMKQTVREKDELDRAFLRGKLGLPTPTKPTADGSVPPWLWRAVVTLCVLSLLAVAVLLVLLLRRR